jgi:hypothetical protein
MDLGDSAHGFRRRLHAARDAQTVPWPALMTRDAFEPLPDVWQEAKAEQWERTLGDILTGKSRAD